MPASNCEQILFEIKSKLWQLTNEIDKYDTNICINTCWDTERSLNFDCV